MKSLAAAAPAPDERDDEACLEPRVYLPTVGMNLLYTTEQILLKPNTWIKVLYKI